jgi:peptidoglycan L-alanyl-D-glutamate endopeptidase CwlK
MQRNHQEARVIFGKRSRDRLKGVHPKLVHVCLKAIEKGVIDFSVIQGVRTKKEQMDLFAQGRTKPGNIVTWTLLSKHLIQPDGYGHAVDLAPFPLDWNDIEKFKALGKLILDTAKEEGIKLTWGATFKNRDYPHFELKEQI